MQDLGPAFERASGHRAHFKFDAAVSLRKGIDEGVPFDVTILTPTLISSLTNDGKLLEDGQKLFCKSRHKE